MLSFAALLICCEHPIIDLGIVHKFGDEIVHCLACSARVFCRLNTNVSSARHGGKAHVNGLYGYGKDELLVAGCAWPDNSHTSNSLPHGCWSLQYQKWNDRSSSAGCLPSGHVPDSNSWVQLLQDTKQVEQLAIHQVLPVQVQQALKVYASYFS